MIMLIAPISSINIEVNHIARIVLRWVTLLDTELQSCCLHPTEIHLGGRE